MMSFRQLNITESLLFLSCDEVSAKDVSEVSSEAINGLTDEWYAFSATADNILIMNGLGDECLDSLWRHAEHVWLCVRMGHGVNFSDEPWVNADVSAALNNAAKQQGSIETYVGDDEMVYIL
jgi:hypothetical protein